MTKVQRGAVILVGGMSYPCDAKSCVALRGSIYPLPCMDYHRVQDGRNDGGGGGGGGLVNCILTSGESERG